MLTVQTLASGSKGNATYIGSGTTKVLVDVGLALPAMLQRLESANIDGASIDAILITHEHSDHITGVGRFATKFGTIVYVHESAFDAFMKRAKSVPQHQVQLFDAPFTIGDIDVDFFPLPHDSSFCFGYTFTCGESKFSMATDLGFMRDDIYEKMLGSQIVLLESNHDMNKLSLNKKYPDWLKRRIAGRTGHLSNQSAGVAAARLFQQGTGQIILGHLSEENNSPTLAYRVVSDFVGEKMKIYVAPQDVVGEKLSI